MANRWGKMKTVTDFIFLGSKITARGDWSHEIKTCLFLGRKAITNLKSILKSRDLPLHTKVCTLKAAVFPVVKYGCENWTIKKAECWKIDDFKLWCWWRLLRVLWTARRSNLKETNPEYSLEKLMLKLQYFGHWYKEFTHWKRPDPDAGKDWRWEKGTTEDEMAGWHRRLNGHEFVQTLGDDERQPGVL